MSNFFAPQQQGQQQMQGQDQSNFITKDEFYSYVRSDSFRSVMKNQNSDLYNFGEWVDYPQASLFSSATYPYTSSSPVSLGTGATKSASYTQIGSTVIYKFYFKFGSSIPAHTGVYLVGLPVQPVTPSGYFDSPAYFSGNRQQEFCGHGYVYGGGSNSFPGPVAWLHAGIISDPSTGKSLSPGKLTFTFGMNQITSYLGELYGDTGPGQDYFVQGVYGTYGHNEYPVQGSVFSGQVTYQSDIIKGN